MREIRLFSIVPNKGDRDHIWFSYYFMSPRDMERKKENICIVFHIRYQLLNNLIYLEGRIAAGF